PEVGFSARCGIRADVRPEQDPLASARHEGVRAGNDLRFLTRRRDVVGCDGAPLLPAAYDGAAVAQVGGYAVGVTGSTSHNCGSYLGGTGRSPQMREGEGGGRPRLPHLVSRWAGWRSRHNLLPSVTRDRSNAVSTLHAVFSWLPALHSAKGGRRCTRSCVCDV